jgi:hypothetical protein
MVFTDKPRRNLKYLPSTKTNAELSVIIKYQFVPKKSVLTSEK